jgi:hypothetical protein
MELGRPRKYAIELKDDEPLHLNEIKNLLNMSREIDKLIDEFWIVGTAFSAPARSSAEQFRNVRLFTLDELVHAVGQGKRSRGQAGAARTRVGKAVLLNEKEIKVLAGALIALIDDKVAELTKHRPNDPDSIATLEASVSELTKLRKQVELLAASVAAFKKGTLKEAKAVKSVTTFSEGVQSWWADGYKTICSSGFSVGLFTTAITISSLAGVSVHGKTATILAGALAGGKPLVDSLKGLGKKLFS